MTNSKILIVDDSQIDQLIIKDILNGYEAVSAYDGFQALEYLKTDLEIDMIILDLNMPKMNGFDVLRHIRKDFSNRDVSVIILTNYEEIENEIMGLELGAVDYVRKPLNSASLIKRIEVHLNLIKARKKINEYNYILEEKVKIRTKELVISRDVTVTALIGLLEVRDIESSNHTKRTQLMMETFTNHLSTKEAFHHILTDSYRDSLVKTTPLHDIGKVGIKDAILLKPSKLTSEEFEEMKGHVQYGIDALTREYHFQEMDEFLKTAVRLIGGHHEKFDGTGYPNQLKGHEIPLEGRLMAIIDVYDALTSKRVYKKAFLHEYALVILNEEKGRHFDPDLVASFMEIESEIKMIAKNYSQERGTFEN